MRLQELAQVIREKEQGPDGKVILSTIHSSKGLEYDNVVLMDVINGVFPSKIIKNFKTATPQEKNECEEERRIFYVGMTRAKDKLTIFKYSGEPSIFVGELLPKEKALDDAATVSGSRKRENVLTKPTMLLKKKTKPAASEKNVPENLIIGERITQIKYGKGVITDVSWDEDEIPTTFTVEFDDGSERKFMFPFAFTTGMKIL